MKRKFVVPLALLALCALCVAIVRVYRQGSVPSHSAIPEKVAQTRGSTPLPPEAPTQLDATASYRPVTRAELGKKPSDRLTLQELESLGQLPIAPSTEELKLAEKTSWWGKPLDPEAFWRGRPVWYDPTDHSATDRGRQLPPVPFDDPSLQQCSTQDYQSSGTATPEGYTPRYVSNDYEQDFWAKWARRLPRPPLMIREEQRRAAQSIMSSEFRSRQPEQRGRPLTADDVARRWVDVGHGGISEGCPREAFGRQALYVTFVLNLYEKDGQATLNALEKWRGIVPDQYLDAPKEQLQEMHKEWQRAYIDRLVKYPKNKPYIRAYAEAWGL